jgi:hypothetical protein
MKLTRKAFCQSLASGTVTLWLQGCGGGGYGGGGSTAAGSSCGAAGSDITANHGHSLTILKADLDSTVDRTYTLTPGTGGHTHDVTFTPAQLAQMKAGGSVTMTSTLADGGIYGGVHSHSVMAQVNVATCL